MISFDAAIPHLFAAALSAYPAVDLFLARGKPRLAGVDYSRVAEPAALNARAARRLAVLPAVALANAGLAGLGWVPGTWLWPVFVAVVVVMTLCIVAEVRRAYR